MRLLRLLTVLLVAGVLQAANLTYRAGGFSPGPDGLPEGWKVSSPRTEIAPRTFLDSTHYRTRPSSLAISGNANAAVYGGWERAISGVKPGDWYRFTAWYRATGVPYESVQILPRVEWTTAAGRRAGSPDYVYQASREGEWTRVTADLQAPKDAAAALLQLYLLNAPQATVWWDDISFESIPAPAPRPVTIASINLRPERTSSPRDSVSQFIAAIEKTAPAKTDVILLPEGITVIGTGKKYVDVAETLPGPTTEMLGQVAKRRSTYIVAGIYERERHTVYNTAVLIDRQGRIAGKYRKVYLPIEEIEAGLTAGSDFPVFRTDFGTVGLMICYDVFFPDPARSLARQGAEVLLMPIWGGNEVLAQARAIDNQVFLAASGYDHPTYIMDPEGTRIAAAPQRGSAAVATVDLAHRWVYPQLGDMKARRMKEWRVDVKVP